MRFWSKYRGSAFFDRLDHTFPRRTARGLRRRQARLGCAIQHRHAGDRPALWREAISPRPSARPSTAARTPTARPRPPARSSASCTASRPSPSSGSTPIGRTIKTACLNLGELGHFGAQLPQTVDELTERTLLVARQMAWQRQPAAADCRRMPPRTGRVPPPRASRRVYCSRGCKRT